MISNQKLSVIKARGRVEAFKHDIRMLSSSIEEAPLWRPGSALKKQCDETLRLITDLEERFDRKMVVTILGPCGAGKSTLLNALSGVDNLSESGHSRPTTRGLVILCRDREDAAPFIREIGSEDTAICSSHGSAGHRHRIAGRWSTANRRRAPCRPPSSGRPWQPSGSPAWRS